LLLNPLAIEADGEAGGAIAIKFIMQINIY